MPTRFGILELPRSVNAAIEHAQLAEAVGFDLIGVADSQSICRDVYATMALMASQTRRIRLGPTVTNALTRHPAVIAGAMATINEIADGRALLGLGSGDSAVLNLGEQPQRLSELREALLTLKQLLQGQVTTWRGRTIHTQWVERPVPLYLAAEGPRTLELAAELADGVICGLGLTPDIIALTLEHLGRGAQRAGRSLDELDIWVLARVNIGDDRQALINEIRMELASTAHHAFRFTLTGKQVPAAFVDAIARVQRGYQPRRHEAIGESPNAQLMNDPAFLDYMVQRFAVLGSAAACVEQVKGIVAAGINQILFTGFVHERQRLMRTLGEAVLARIG